MKNLLYILLLLPLVTTGQTSSQNYVMTYTYHDETTTSDAAKAQVDVTYADGLGRPMQQLNGKASATGKDIITHISYDQFGRQAKQFLPYPATTANLAYDASAESNTIAHYNTPEYDNTTNPYTEQFFEASPLDRVRKTGAPGTPWMGNTANDNDHTIKYVYQTNAANEVKRLTATATWNSSLGVYNTSFSNSGYYNAGQLYKTITRDENWTSGSVHTTEEFKNRQGQVLLKRTYNGNQKHDTYYVYDQYGNLTYVLPPLAEGTLAPDLCYYYKYDSRNRIVEKKLPGKQWEFIIYDQLDRVIATGPAYSPFGDDATGWVYHMYDQYSRLCLTGWYPQSVNNASRKVLQADHNGTVHHTLRSPSQNLDNITINYRPSGVPSGYKLLAVYYYDDYTWTGAPALPSTIEGQSVLTNANGLATGGWTRAVTTATETFGETNYSIYDSKKQRPVRTRTTNHLGGYTQTDTNFDFDGSALYTINRHKRISGSTEIVVREDFTYTPQYRPLAHTHKINSLPSQTLVQNEYDELGQLIIKQVGQYYPTAGLPSAPMQTVNFKYNVRGWLTDINDVNNIGSDKFAFRISYNTPSDDGGLSTDALYNGNISETYWRSDSDNILRKYSYLYDHLNRLNEAYYQKPEEAVSLTFSYYEFAYYDKNGNIQNLGRTGGFDDPVNYLAIDELTYLYHPTIKNRLITVGDSTLSPQGFKDNGPPYTGDDYTYDDNGNMTSDRNKGITSISYNHLNLPVEIMKKTVIDDDVTVEVDYLTGYQYKNGVLQFFPTAEGYVENTCCN